MEQSLEARLESLEASVATLRERLEEKERQIQDLLDIEAIERLQNAYAYYLEHWMSEDIIDLFADRPETSATYVEGTYLGLEGVRRYFGKMKMAPPEFLHMVMMATPVITLSEDRQSAKGRFYGYGTICSTPINNAPDPIYMSVTYEMEFVREDGVWKILKLAFQMNYAYKTPRPAQEGEPPRSDMAAMKLSPDIWAKYNTQYPSGYIYPMHFKHPVTGRETCEAAYNDALTLLPSPFKPD